MSKELKKIGNKIALFEWEEVRKTIYNDEIMRGLKVEEFIYRF